MSFRGKDLILLVGSKILAAPGHKAVHVYPVKEAFTGSVITPIIYNFGTCLTPEGNTARMSWHITEHCHP